MKRHRTLIVTTLAAVTLLCLFAWWWPARWIIPTTKRIRGVSPGGAILLPVLPTKP